MLPSLVPLRYVIFGDGRHEVHTMQVAPSRTFGSMRTRVIQASPHVLTAQSFEIFAARGRDGTFLETTDPLIPAIVAGTDADSVRNVFALQADNSSIDEGLGPEFLAQPDAIHVIVFPLGNVANAQVWTAWLRPLERVQLALGLIVALVLWIAAVYALANRSSGIVALAVGMLTALGGLVSRVLSILRSRRERAAAEDGVEVLPVGGDAV